MNSIPNDLDPDDELRAENELLKLKLELEHGMMQTGSSSLNPDVENTWLKNIYEFERQHKEAKRVAVYDAIGKPPYRKADEMKPEEITAELNSLLNIMGEKGIALDCICDYDDDVIYRFLTEELFDHEIDDISIPGMVYHFTYEEFHPNHDYDLRCYVKEFAEKLYGCDWHPEYDTLHLSKKISFNNKLFDKAGISAIIQAFQEAHQGLVLNAFETVHLEFDLEGQTGNADGRLTYSTVFSGKSQSRDGNWSARFLYDKEFGYWYICEFKFPELEE